MRPQDRELLADPAMVYGGGAPGRHEQHVLENREAARAATGAGGGCGCN
ncbi:MAG: DUF4266 domain-containing protein [Polyangiales bacterium]